MSMEDMTRMKYCLHFWASWWLLTLWALCSADWWSSVTFLFFFLCFCGALLSFPERGKNQELPVWDPSSMGLSLAEDGIHSQWFGYKRSVLSGKNSAMAVTDHPMSWKSFPFWAILWSYDSMDSILNLRNREQLLVALFAGTHLTKDTFELPWWASNLLRVFFLWGSRALRACQTALHFSHGIQNINHPYTLWMENCRNVLRSLTDAWS